MQELTKEQEAAIRAACPGAIKVRVGEDAVLLVRPLDKAAVDGWFNGALRSLADANRATVTRALLWPSGSELQTLRRRFAHLDREVMQVLLDVAGDLDNRLIEEDPLDEDMPAALVERAGLDAATVVELLEQTRAQHREAVLVYVDFGPDAEPFAAVLASPRPADLVPLGDTSQEGKRRRAEAVRTLAVGCALWTRGGTPGEVFAARPALPISLKPVIDRLGGDGAIRAMKSAG